MFVSGMMKSPFFFPPFRNVLVPYPRTGMLMTCCSEKNKWMSLAFKGYIR